MIVVLASLFLSLFSIKTSLTQLGVPLGNSSVFFQANNNVNEHISIIAFFIGYFLSDYKILIINYLTSVNLLKSTLHSPRFGQKQTRHNVSQLSLKINKNSSSAICGLPSV
jgi:hypothetical protein